MKKLLCVLLIIFSSTAYSDDIYKIGDVYYEPYIDPIDGQYSDAIIATDDDHDWSFIIKCQDERAYAILRLNSSSLIRMISLEESGSDVILRFDDKPVIKSDKWKMKDTYLIAPDNLTQEIIKQFRESTALYARIAFPNHDGIRTKKFHLSGTTKALRKLKCVM